MTQSRRLPRRCIAGLRAFAWPAARDGDLVQAARERLLVLFSLTAGTGGLITTLASIGSFAQLPATISSSLAGALLLFAVPVHFHLTRAYRRSAWALVVLYILPIVMAMAMTGGLLAAGSIYLLAAPIVGGLLLGLHAAIGVGGLLILVFALFYALQDRVGVPVHGMDPAHMNYSMGFVLILLTAGLTVIIGTFQRVIEATNLDLKRARDQAEAANEAKSRFLANMSHELRTPLNGILGFADLLAGRALDAESRDHLRHIRAAGHDLLALVNDVLDFTRAEAGSLRLEQASFDLYDLVDDLRDRFRPRMATKQLDFATVIDPQVPRLVRGDPLRLRQVIGNLLDNALKFTDRGAVTLAVRAVPAAGGDGPPADAALIRFEVTDTGSGIAEAALPSLFDRFTQADSSTTRRYGGSGLGLAIVKALVELMDGAVGVSSEVGAGSRFWFTASLPPAAGLHPAVAAAEPAPVAPARRRARQPGEVLLVEDSITNQNLFRTVLTGAGHRVRIAANGQAALDCLRDQRFDLVLMDGQMPVMGGMETARAIRGSGETFADVPIIALTANALDRDVADFREAGMNDYLAKPVDLNRLLDMVEDWIDWGQN
ncbi:ATP-binding protein [Marinibaculum pumilum]|uniref:histidine kinase n=1 Tax=Marinibaculum pumilum TaxID=1766165 RepID=A0ABV7L8U9_9PROT